MTGLLFTQAMLDYLRAVNDRMMDELNRRISSKTVTLEAMFKLDEELEGAPAIGYSHMTGPITDAIRQFEILKQQITQAGPNNPFVQMLDAALVPGYTPGRTAENTPGNTTGNTAGNTTVPDSIL